MDKLTTPFILVAAGIDKLINPEAYWDLYEKAPAKLKNILWYPKSWHDVWRDPLWE